ncbi:MAG: hypothetical protein K9N06_10245 [Candidatus Cloacimonetes bacterium]|nr:hypothetical protein [Candidatus Cloacimonadota bacterium]
MKKIKLELVDGQVFPQCQYAMMDADVFSVGISGSTLRRSATNRRFQMRCF